MFDEVTYGKQIKNREDEYMRAIESLIRHGFGRIVPRMIFDGSLQLYSAVHSNPHD